MINEIEAKSILLYNKNPQNWFGVHYYLNIYRGCTHGCIYCDTRSECYKIDNFDKEINVKINAVNLLTKELAKKRKKGLIGFGSTTDPYIPLEAKYRLTREALKIVRDYHNPLFLLTKSDLVLSDIDIISEINNDTSACIAFTITTANDKLASIIEPNAPKPSSRFKAMKTLTDKGIKCGILIMPVLPFITDKKENIEEIVCNASLSGVSFIYFYPALTLRDRQRDYFYQHISDNLKKKYISTYGSSYNCNALNYRELMNYFNDLCIKYNIKYDMQDCGNEKASIQTELF